MYCKKCEGRVFIDRVFSSDLRIELFCVMCGKRWMVKNSRSGFAEWLNRGEKLLAKINAGTSFI